MALATFLSYLGLHPLNSAPGAEAVRVPSRVPLTGAVVGQRPSPWALKSTTMCVCVRVCVCMHARGDRADRGLLPGMTAHGKGTSAHPFPVVEGHP